MQRTTSSISVAELGEQFRSIDFPGYQREPTVWDLDQKRKLIDSIYREFDISAIYMYKTPTGQLECIDGQQRITAIASYLGINELGEDNQFRTTIVNEITAHPADDLAPVDGLNWSEIQGQASASDELRQLRDAFLGYQVTMVTLSGARTADDFNLQFLRLNLGTLINAGERLHAMVGEARDLVFGQLGTHSFLERTEVPTRRYAKEQIAAQLFLQAYNLRTRGEFTRARHPDLQRFLKEQYELNETASEVATELEATLDALDSADLDWSGLLKNRAISVSVVLLAWDLSVRTSDTSTDDFFSFVQTFASALAAKAEQMKTLDPQATAQNRYLIDFQRNITQAAIEKPAVTHRHATLTTQAEAFFDSGELLAEYLT